MPKVETEILENRQARLTVTVEPERLDHEMKAAARRIAKQVNIPGFRRGKAPYHVVERHYGWETILEEALDPLGQAVYVEALEESGLEPYAPGVLSDFQRDPLVLTFTVPLMPEVDLGDYRAVRIPFEVEEVTEADVDEVLEDLRDEHATLDPVKRPIEMGSVALLDIVGTWVRGEEESKDEEGDLPSTWLNRHGVRVRIAEEATYPVPGFPEKVVGMAAGDERSFDISFPEDNKELDETLHGKTLHFEVKCREVYEYNVPPLTDEFAREVGEYASLADLRANLREELERAAQRTAHDEYVDKVFDYLLEEVVTVTYPPIMVEEQIDRMLDDLDRRLRDQGLNLDEYLKLRNMDEQRIRDDLREEAAERLKRALVLGEIAEAEQLHVTEEEIEDEIETAVLSFGPQAGAARQVYRTAAIKRSLANQLLGEKAINRMVAIAKGENPPIGEETSPDGEDRKPEGEVVADLMGAFEEAASTGAETDAALEEPEMAVAGGEAEAGNGLTAGIERADAPSGEAAEGGNHPSQEYRGNE